MNEYDMTAIIETIDEAVNEIEMEKPCEKTLAGMMAGIEDDISNTTLMVTLGTIIAEWAVQCGKGDLDKSMFFANVMSTYVIRRLAAFTSSAAERRMVN